MFFSRYMSSYYMSLFARDTKLMNMITSIVYLSLYKCRCFFIFILKTDVPRLSCDISVRIPKTIVSVVKNIPIIIILPLV